MKSQTITKDESDLEIVTERERERERDKESENRTTRESHSK